MPSPALGAFGKMMFEKRMREKMMGQDPMGNFKDEMMPSPAPPVPPAPPQVQQGFDNSALMQDPKFRQEDTMNQGNRVSEPYREANQQAFDKINPMNAVSQETPPIQDRVDEFLKRNEGQLPGIINQEPFLKRNEGQLPGIIYQEPFLIPKRNK